MTTQPLLFGYIRLREPGHGAHLPDIRKLLREYAAREGYTLSEILVEHDRGGTAAFARILELMHRYPGSRAVVPSLTDLAELPSLRVAMCELVERETGGAVLVATADDAAVRAHPELLERTEPGRHAPHAAKLRGDRQHTDDASAGEVTS